MVEWLTRTSTSPSMRSLTARSCQSTLWPEAPLEATRALNRCMPDLIRCETNRLRLRHRMDGVEKGAADARQPSSLRRQPRLRRLCPARNSRPCGALDDCKRELHRHMDDTMQILRQDSEGAEVNLVNN